MAGSCGKTCALVTAALLLVSLAAATIAAARNGPLPSRAEGSVAESAVKSWPEDCPQEYSRGAHAVRVALGPIRRTFCRRF